MTFKKKYILNAFFIIGLTVLFINDHFLKEVYGNWVTGKLSDIAGVFILPLFLSYFFPKHIQWNLLATALFFTFWKLPISENFIQFYNEFALISITRVVDYTDLIALAILPFSYIVLNRIKKTSVAYLRFQKVPQVALMIVACMVFMATSPPKSHYYTESSGDLRFNTSIKVSESEALILQKLLSDSIIVQKDSVLIKELNHFSAEEYSEKKETFRYYIVDHLQLKEELVHNVQFSFYTSEKGKTKLYLNAMKVTDSVKESAPYEELQKQYQEKIKERFKQAIH